MYLIPFNAYNILKPHNYSWDTLYPFLISKAFRIVIMMMQKLVE
jgi:hypothetical protein